MVYLHAGLDYKSYEYKSIHFTLGAAIECTPMPWGALLYAMPIAPTTAMAHPAMPCR